MSGGPDWFAPKRYGFGIGVPISWQGWALSVAFIAITVGLSATLAHRPLQLLALLVPVISTFIVIAARTTKGGWRWGRED